MAYDQTDFTLKRERVHITTAGNATVSGKFTSFATLLLKRMNAMVITAGTSATTGNKVDLYVGTASVASITLGSDVAGTLEANVDLTALAAVAVGTPVSFKNGTDATGVASVTLEYTEQPS